MRELAPELKRIKKEAKGDRQLESKLTMELYKEREINPFATIGIVLLQLPILIGLYIGLRRVITDPQSLITYAYEPFKDTAYLKELSQNIKSFDATLFGVVDLSKAALSKGVYYVPALIIAVGSAVIQYFQSKQLTPDQGNAKSVREILKESSTGKQADQAEMNAAVSRVTIFMIPGMILLISLGLQSALPLYWLTSGLVAFFQQSRVLKQDATELVSSTDSGDKVTITQPKKKPAAKKSKKKKR
jgi:YidC/Oxa1 family membrane protein insertase